MLNGVEIGIKSNHNIISLFDLSPDTPYYVQVWFEDGNIISTEFRTAAESVAINLLDFLPTRDGFALDTKALQAAIDFCPSNGRIVIPQGTYLISPVTLKSNITIELKEGAVLLGSTYMSDYKVLPGKVTGYQQPNTNYDRQSNVQPKVIHISYWQGMPIESYQPLLCAYGASNINIVGKGTIDGNAKDSIWKADANNKNIARPKLLFLNGCSNILLHGNNYVNSACWCIHSFFCNNVGIYDTNIVSLNQSLNNDGINPESCDNTAIIGCNITVNDNCISVKACKFEVANSLNKPCKNIIIRNCVLRQGHSGITIGHQLGAGLYNMYVYQCLIISANRGLSSQSYRGSGGSIKNLSLKNIIMIDVATPISINCFYNGDNSNTEHIQSRKPQLPNKGTPAIDNLKFENIVCTGVRNACIFIYALPESPIQNIVFNNLHFGVIDTVAKGMVAELDGITECSKRGLITLNVSNIVQHNVVYDGIDGHDFFDPFGVEYMLSD
jgi:polygalacturonase